ncbi:LicD family protein [Psychrobacter fozii]|uniref:Lipopolysaccharide cholinephosphotransferase n=1 Tax=Psychrobacter fozii TaxID=198480 RepID=A0A2V4VPK0_9GAMM|nr:LicD family protein [Psychrobacter fozii]PYE40865.1 lipopolysaccharide cholinephosphotransferase [Psychrobacter fozii]
MNNIRSLQLKTVEMMREVDALFRANNIHYTLLGGSVLGAIRHTGFIPWDDDMDIGILRQDYHTAERLLATLKSYTYEYAEKHIIPDAPVGHLRFSKDLSNLASSATIDVFALDYVPVKQSQRKRFRLIANIYHACILRRAPENRGALSRSVLKLLFACFPHTFLDYLQTLSKQKLLNSSLKKQGHIGNVFGAWGEKEYFYQDIYMDLIFVAFEGLELPIPRRYDNYLSQLYGDYRQLPPIEQRVPKHIK